MKFLWRLTHGDPSMDFPYKKWFLASINPVVIQNSVQPRMNMIVQSNKRTITQQTLSMLNTSKCVWGRIDSFHFLPSHPVFSLSMKSNTPDCFKHHHGHYTLPNFKIRHDSTSGRLHTAGG